MKRILAAAIAATIALGMASTADAKFGSSSFSSSRSFSSSSSFSRSSSWSSPSAYSVRSTTYSSSYRPAPSAAGTAWRSTISSAPASVGPSTTINHTVIVNRSSPVIIHHYGYGYGGSGLGFWHGMMLGQMFNRQPVVVAGGAYGPGYAAPAPVVGYGYGWSPVELLVACLVGIVVIIILALTIRAALRERDVWDD